MKHKGDVVSLTLSSASYNMTIIIQQMRTLCPSVISLQLMKLYKCIVFIMYLIGGYVPYNELLLYCIVLYDDVILHMALVGCRYFCGMNFDVVRHQFPVFCMIISLHKFHEMQPSCLRSC